MKPTNPLDEHPPESLEDERLENGGLAISWAALIDTSRDEIDWALDLIEDDSDPAPIAGAWDILRALSVPAGPLSKAAIVDGPERVAGLLARLSSAIEPALEWIRANPTSDVPALGRAALTMSMLAESCGLPAPIDLRAAARELLPLAVAQVHDPEDPIARTLALVSVSLGMDDSMSGFLAEPLEPTETHAPHVFDIPGLTYYLARALRERAGSASVETVWINALRRFPILLAANEVEWPDLMWLGRIALHDIGGAPATEVSERLHSLVHEF